MDKLFAFIGDISDPRVGGGDTFVDRVNCRYTPMLLLVFALLVTTKNYVGEPIACWCPDHFTKAQVDYTNQVRGRSRQGGEEGVRLLTENNNYLNGCSNSRS